MDSAPVNGDRDPGGQVQNYKRGMASRCKGVALEKWPIKIEKTGKVLPHSHQNLCYNSVNSG